MGEAGQRFYFFRLIDGTNFGRLGNRDHFRLDVMLITYTVVGLVHGFYS